MIQTVHLVDLDDYYVFAKNHVNRTSVAISKDIIYVRKIQPFIFVQKIDVNFSYIVIDVLLP